MVWKGVKFNLLVIVLGNKFLIICNGDEIRRKLNFDWINYFVYISIYYIFNVFCDKKKFCRKNFFVVVYIVILVNYCMVGFLEIGNNIF